MANRKSLILGASIIMMSIAALVIVQAYQQKHGGLSSGPLSFPYIVRKEERVEPLGPKSAIWEMDIILSKEHYNKNHLEELFRFYSNKHPETEELIQIKVYTDLEEYERRPNSESPLIGIPDPGHEPSKSDLSAKDRPIGYDAVFYRERDNEWFIYHPSLVDIDETETVVLKGKDPYDQRTK